MDYTEITNDSSPDFVSFFTCFIIDLPAEHSSNATECSKNGSNVCIKFSEVSGFLSGESVTDTKGSGHYVCLTLWILICFIGMFGAVSNILILLIMTQGKQFDFLIRILAFIDLLCGTSAILSATSLTMCLEGLVTLGTFALTNFIHISNMFLFVTRSMSVYMTVFVTTYSYLGLAYPLRSREWFIWRRIKIIPILVLFIGILLNIPRIGSSYVDKNKYYKAAIDIPTLQKLEYISYVRIDWRTFWYETMFKIHDYLDFVLPLFTLIFLNILSYHKMRRLKRERRDSISSTQSKNGLKPAKMFLPVVTFLLFCNFGIILAFAMVYRNNVMLRELYLGCLCWNCLNSSANFVIYYWRAEAFRIKTQKWYYKLTHK